MTQAGLAPARGVMNQAGHDETCRGRTSFRYPRQDLHSATLNHGASNRPFPTLTEITCRPEGRTAGCRRRLESLNPRRSVERFFRRLWFCGRQLALRGRLVDRNRQIFRKEVARLIKIHAGRLSELFQLANANRLTDLDGADRLVLAGGDPGVDLATETRRPEVL